MFVDKWKPVFAPENEAGSPEPEAEGGAPPTGGRDGGDEAPSGPGSGRSNLRQQLEKNFETDRKAGRDREREPARRAAPKSRAREHLEAEGGQEPAEGQEPEVEAEVEETAALPAPNGWAPEAKAEWAKTPQAVQAAVIKREQDMAKGVEELKGKYADIDKVLAPRLEIMRRHGHRPHEAVNQLFSWFDALSANPDVAFPALAASFRYDLRRVMPQQQQQQQQQPNQQQTEQQRLQAAQQQQPAEGEQPPGDIPPGVQQYIHNLQQEMVALRDGVEKQFGSLQATFAQQSQAKTDDMLANWSKDKPHFEKVRTLMGKLIVGMSQDGSVPLLQNGSVDLDSVYDMALYASPEVRQELLAAAEQSKEDERKKKVDTERKAQQAQVDKSRRAAVGVASGAPGANGTGSPTKRAGPKKVGDSIREAIKELSE